MVSLRAGLAIAGASLGGIYAVGQARDNRRYWNSYARRTGVRVRYPYRAGVNDYLKYAGQAFGYSAIGAKNTKMRFIR